MPVTITAGVTFSGGGLTMAFAPPSQGTAGWFGSGSIDRITFATDTTTASVRGSLNNSTIVLGAAGTLDAGWFGGGTGGGAPWYSYAIVQRITYATDTATAAVRGSLAAPTRTVAASGNTTAGWFGGGYNGPAGDPTVLSLVSRITYATDTATASQRGPLSLARKKPGSVSDNSTYSWFAGGGSPGQFTTVDRITYATDTATATVRGPLAAGTYAASGMGNSTYGWFCGGLTYISSVSRIDYSNDTTTASVRGPLSAGKGSTGAAGNLTDGWVSGGTAPTVSTVDRITYATDTATATVRGSLSSAKYGIAGVAGIQ
jgi:hypothetical protein